MTVSGSTSASRSSSATANEPGPALSFAASSPATQTSAVAAAATHQWVVGGGDARPDQRAEGAADAGDPGEQGSAGVDPDGASAVGDQVDRAADRDHRAQLLRQLRRHLGDLLGAGRRVDPAATETSCQRADLGGVAANHRRSSARPGAGEFGPQRQRADRHRIQHPGHPGRRRSADGDVHPGRLRGRHRAQIDQQRPGDTGQHARILRVVHHRRAGAGRQQRVRGEIGDNGVGDAVHQRGCPPELAQGLGGGSGDLRGRCGVVRIGIDPASGRVEQVHRASLRKYDLEQVPRVHLSRRPRPITTAGQPAPRAAAHHSRHRLVPDPASVNR